MPESEPSGAVASESVTSGAENSHTNTNAGGIASDPHSGAPDTAPPSYSSQMISEIGASAPVRLLHSLLDEADDDGVERVEHFKYKQDLERKLTVTSVIGLGFSVMGVPFGLSSTLWISLMDGGNVTILYGWLVVAFFSICVVLSLSEIISKYPTAGGVYHFSALLSNEKYSLISSWITGWFLLIGNWTYAVSIMFAGSEFILSIFGLKDVYYKEDIFLVLGIYFILLAICGFINFKFSKHLEKINKMCIVWTIYTVLAIDFLLIFFAKRTNSIKEILTNFDNSRSGWPDALAFMVGLQSSSFTLTGYGMLFSMTDEVKNPERNMAKGAVSAISISTVTGLIFIIPILTILPELSLLLDETPEIMPIDLVFKLATESYIISFLLVVLLIGTVLFQAIGSLTTASRTTYAFARDGGLPFKNYWIEVDSVEESTIPKNALFLSMSVCAVLSLLSLISTSAFNAFMGASVVSLALANGIPIFCLMLNKRRKIKGAVFRLRRLGWLINFLSVFWVIISFVILCLPPVIKNLTWRSMNYAIVVICGFFGFAALGYKLWGITSFEGPQLDTDYFELHNLEAAGRVNFDISDSFVIGVDDEVEDEEFDGASTIVGKDRSNKKGYAPLSESGDDEEQKQEGKSVDKNKKDHKGDDEFDEQGDIATTIEQSSSQKESSKNKTSIPLDSSDSNELSTESETEILFETD
ncbi:putative amino-acid permease [Scheffersomyces xylosifermentans]|uniref:putative amino-acid permease n=1 Tax=Scheffersomyces xylosifermentans TaxID=1304137 RepID=UPI00315DC344